MSTKFLFDQASVDALEKREKEWVAWDEGLAGFGVRILASGTKSWIVSEKTRREDGKVRSRRIGIGRLPEMSLEEARTKAREILGEAGGDGVDKAGGESSPAEGAAIPASQVDGQAVEEGGLAPDGGDRATPVSPAAETTAAPDRPAEPAPNDAAVEEEPRTGAGAETVLAPVTSTGEIVDPETGEIQPAGMEEPWDPDEGLGDLDEMGQGPDAGRDPEAVPGVDADDKQTDSALAGAIDRVTGAGAVDPYGEVAETAGRAEQPGMPRVEAQGGPDPGRGDDGHGEADTAGEYRDGEVDDDQSKARDQGREGPGGKETAGSGPGRMERAWKAVSEPAGKVIMGGRTLMSKKAEETPAEKEPAETARDDPEPGRPASGKVETAETGGAEGSDEPKLEARKGTTAGVEEESRDGNQLSEDSVAGLAKNLDEMRGVVDRIEAWSDKMGPQIEMLSGSTTVLAGDRRRGRRRVARAVVAMAAMLALGIAGGVALQSRVEVAPQADPTLGWKDHFWNYYGETLMECFQRAKKAESGYMDCAVKVRGR